MGESAFPHDLSLLGVAGLVRIGLCIPVAVFAIEHPRVLRADIRQDSGPADPAAELRPGHARLLTGTDCLPAAQVSRPLQLQELVFSGLPVR